MKSKISYILLCVIVLAGILANCAINKRTAFVMKSYEYREVKDEYLEVLWSPELALKKGSYTFEIDCDEYDSANELQICTDNQGTIYTGEKTNDTLVCRITLSEDCDNVYIKTISRPGESPTELNHITITSGRMINSDPILWACAAFILMLYIYMLKSRKSLTKNPDAKIYLILLLSALFVSYPAFMPYIVYGHDINFHLLRIEGIQQGLMSGQFPVRIHPNMNNGYGMVSGAMYPEMFLYIPAVLRIMGVSLVDSYHTFLMLINIAAAFVMYYSAKTITKSKYGGLCAAVVYTLSTWRLMNVFMRSALGEALSMVFFPLVLLGLYQIIKGDRKKWYILALGMTGVIQSHIIGTMLAVIAAVVMVLIYIVRIIKEKRFFELIGAAALTVVLNLWYIVPFLRYYAEDLAVHHSNNQFLTHMVMPGQLFDALNNCMGDSMAVNLGTNGEMSQSLGILVLLAAAACIMYYIFGGKAKNSFAKSGFMIGAALVFMSTTLFPWKLLMEIGVINTVTTTIQFPWRFLSYATAFMCISFGEVTSVYEKHSMKNVILGAVVVTGAFAAVVSLNAYTQQDVLWGKNQGVETVTMAKEYIYFGTNTDEFTPNEYTVSDAEAIKTGNVYKKATNVSFSFANSGGQGYIEVPIAYYPGYKAYGENGREYEIEKGDNNRLRVIIPQASEGSVRIRYAGLKGFAPALWISIAAYVLLAAFMVRKYILRRKEKQQQIDRD